jgi:hypothetical protein
MKGAIQDQALLGLILFIAGLFVVIFILYAVVGFNFLDLFSIA